MGQQPVCRETERCLCIFPAQDGIRRHLEQCSIEGTIETLPSLAQKHWGVLTIIHRKGVVHRDGRVKQITGMYGGACKVSADGLQQHLTPLPGHGLIHRSDPRSIRTPVNGRHYWVGLAIQAVERQKDAPHHQTSELGSVHG